MGSQPFSSQQINQHWQQIIKQLNYLPGHPTLLKSIKQSNLYAQRYLVEMINTNKQQQNIVFSYRQILQSNIVTVYHFQITNGILTCTPNSDFYTIITQHIPYRLSNFKNLINTQIIYIFYQCLKGYRQLCNYSFSCYPTLNMIGIKQNAQIKVWINQNWSDNRYNLARNQKTQIQTLWNTIKITSNNINLQKFNIIFNTNNQVTFQKYIDIINNRFSNQVIQGRFILEKRIKSTKNSFNSYMNNYDHQQSQYLYTYQLLNRPRAQSQRLSRQSDQSSDLNQNPQIFTNYNSLFPQKYEATHLFLQPKRTNLASATKPKAKPRSAISHQQSHSMRSSEPIYCQESIMQSSKNNKSFPSYPYTINIQQASKLIESRQYYNCNNLNNYNNINNNSLKNMHGNKIDTKLTNNKNNNNSHLNNKQQYVRQKQIPNNIKINNNQHNKQDQTNYLINLNRVNANNNKVQKKRINFSYQHPRNSQTQINTNTIQQDILTKNQKLNYNINTPHTPRTYNGHINISYSNRQQNTKLDTHPIKLPQENQLPSCPQQNYYKSLANFPQALVKQTSDHNESSTNEYRGAQSQRTNTNSPQTIIQNVGGSMKQIALTQKDNNTICNTSINQNQNYSTNYNSSNQDIIHQIENLQIKQYYTPEKLYFQNQQEVNLSDTQKVAEQFKFYLRSFSPQQIDKNQHNSQDNMGNGNQECYSDRNKMNNKIYQSIPEIWDQQESFSQNL